MADDSKGCCAYCESAPLLLTNKRRRQRLIDFLNKLDKSKQSICATCQFVTHHPKLSAFLADEEWAAQKVIEINKKKLPYSVSIASLTPTQLVSFKCALWDARLSIDLVPVNPNTTTTTWSIFSSDS